MTLRSLAIPALIAASLALSACGQKVEIPSAHVAKIMTKDGYKDGVYTTSKFRLDFCIWYCDKLVLLDVSDHSFAEPMELFMPKDKLNMGLDLRMTLAVDPEAYDSIFSRIPPTHDANRGIDYIALKGVYNTYARQIIRAEAREFLSQYTISEVASSLETINSQLSQRLSTSISTKTPFAVRYVGMDDLKYPDIIVKAQERSAERREMIQQEEAQMEISKVQSERRLQEQRMQRAIDVEKAEAEAQVNKILADSITPNYVRYRSLNSLDKIAESQNKVFVPSEMLGTLAGQVMLGNSDK